MFTDGRAAAAVQSIRSPFLGILWYFAGVDDVLIIPRYWSCAMNVADHSLCPKQ